MEVKMTTKIFTKTKLKAKEKAIEKWSVNYKKIYNVDPTKEQLLIFSTAYNMGHKAGQKEKADTINRKLEKKKSILYLLNGD